MKDVVFNTHLPLLCKDSIVNLCDRDAEKYVHLLKTSYASREILEKSLYGLGRLASLRMKPKNPVCVLRAALPFYQGFATSRNYVYASKDKTTKKVQVIGARPTQKIFLVESIIAQGSTVRRILDETGVSNAEVLAAIVTSRGCLNLSRYCVKKGIQLRIYGYIFTADRAYLDSLSDIGDRLYGSVRGKEFMRKFT